MVCVCVSTLMLCQVPSRRRGLCGRPQCLVSSPPECSVTWPCYLALLPGLLPGLVTWARSKIQLEPASFRCCRKSLSDSPSSRPCTWTWQHPGDALLLHTYTCTHVPTYSASRALGPGGKPGVSASLATDRTVSCVPQP